MKSKAVVFTAIDEIEVRDVELPPLEENQILTKTIYTFVSPGTELRTLAGYYGAEKYYPIVPGYAVISRVIEIGSAVKNYRVGDILDTRAGGEFTDVTGWFGGQSAYHVYPDDAEIHVLLPDMTDEELLSYAVTEVAAISYRGVRMADPQQGDEVLVIGQGMIGRFSAEFHRLAGANVTVCDVDENRLKEAAAAGFSTVDLKDVNAAERLACYSGKGFDIVVECAGYPAAVATAYSQVKQKIVNSEKSYNFTKNTPKLVMQASYVETVAINPSTFFRNEFVQLITPYDRDFYDRKMVTELIRRKEFDTTPYIKNIFTPDEFVGAYRKLQKHEISSAVFKWI